jgi:hypothetical protein
MKRIWFLLAFLYFLVPARADAQTPAVQTELERRVHSLEEKVKALQAELRSRTSGSRVQLRRTSRRGVTRNG